MRPVDDLDGMGFISPPSGCDVEDIYNEFLRAHVGVLWVVGRMLEMPTMRQLRAAHLFIKGRCVNGRQCLESDSATVEEAGLLDVIQQTEGVFQAVRSHPTVIKLEMYDLATLLSVDVLVAATLQDWVSISALGLRASIPLPQHYEKYNYTQQRCYAAYKLGQRKACTRDSGKNTPRGHGHTETRRTKIHHNHSRSVATEPYTNGQPNDSAGCKVPARQTPFPAVTRHVTDAVHMVPKWWLPVNCFVFHCGQASGTPIRFQVRPCIDAWFECPEQTKELHITVIIWDRAMLEGNDYSRPTYCAPATRKASHKNDRRRTLLLATFQDPRFHSILHPHRHSTHHRMGWEEHYTLTVLQLAQNIGWVGWPVCPHGPCHLHQRRCCHRNLRPRIQLHSEGPLYDSQLKHQILHHSIGHRSVPLSAYSTSPAPFLSHLRLYHLPQKPDWCHTPDHLAD
ncbi:uncharacterized protein G2W53_017612 [Senna tora]|uniref:Uncharacterized protein n=1 Tax=Senna tora TaxID=362788 RepID=A0A834TQA6_9FABA|nr:uncharacterized protein G2W53_017612 [Senna tora]